MARPSAFARARIAIARAIAPDAVRRFDAASGSRRFGRESHFGSTSTEALAAAPAVRGRGRYLYNNNSYAHAGVEAIVDNAAGTGITPTPTHPDPDVRAAISAEWNRFMKRADADGMTDGPGVWANAVRALVTDGEAFLQIVETRMGPKLRLIPAEMVDEAKTADLGDGRYIVAGVEFNAAGERVAYWVMPMKPTDVVTYAPSIRIPASDILHLMAPIGAGQVRGVSWLAPVLLRLSEIDGLEDALLAGFKVAALHAAFLVDLNGTSDVPYDADESGLVTGLEPGTMKRIPPGMDIKFNSPQQAIQSTEYLKAQIHAVAAGLGVPFHLVSSQVGEANYSSLRAAMLAFRARIERIQYSCIIPCMARYYERFVTSAILSGRIKAPDFESNMADYLDAEYIPCAMEWVDPAKDIQATKEAIESGLMSRRQAVSALGWNIEALDSEIAADREREKALGLTFNAPKT